MHLRVAGLLFLSLSIPVAGADWPDFLGPNRDAVSTETGLVERVPEGGLPVAWEREVGTGYSAPSVQGETLVVFHRQGAEEVVEALDAGTGVTRWRAAYPSSFRDPYGYNNGPRCAPVIAGDRVFTFGAEGRLSAWALGDGKALWHRDTAREFDIPEAFFGVGSTPLLEGGRLIVMVGGQPDSGVIAVDPGTGRTLWESVGRRNWEGQPMHDWPGNRRVEWKSWEKTASYASPVAATVNGQRLVYACMRQGLVALDPTDGAVRFSRWFRARVDESVNAMTPLVAGNDVLISSAYYRSGSVRLHVQAGNTNVTEVWKGLGLEMHWSQPVLVDGHLYGFSGRNEPDARLRCVDFATGEVRWERDESWPKYGGRQPPVFGRGALVRVEGRLLALGEGGLLGMFVPDPKECREVGRWQVPSLRFPCWAGPVVASRRIHLRSEDRLVCLEAAAR